MHHVKDRIDAMWPHKPALPPQARRANVDGWYSVEPSAPKSRQHDALGLQRSANAADLVVPRVQDADAAAIAGCHTTRGCRKLPHRSPRGRSQLAEQQDESQHRANAAAGSGIPGTSRPPMLMNTTAPSPVLAPLSLSRLKRDACEVGSVKATRAACGRRQQAQCSPRLQRLVDPTQLEIPAMETVQALPTDAIDVARLFLGDWMERFAREQSQYKSLVLHAEVAFQELHRLTAHLPLPNETLTTFACHMLESMAPHFGTYAHLVHVLSQELSSAIYTPATDTAPAQPYYTVVATSKRRVSQLRKQLVQRQQRNARLRDDTVKMQCTLLHFLDQAARCLTRSVFREWYRIIMVRKRTTRKYMECFSEWFGRPSRTLLPRAFAVWKLVVRDAQTAKLQDHCAKDQERLEAIEKRLEERTIQRDAVQQDNIAARNDRKATDDRIQRLTRKTQAAIAYLETTHLREALVASETHLRAEATTFLPPLVLESLLRGVHNLGFVQQLHAPSTKTAVKDGEEQCSANNVDASAKYETSCSSTKTAVRAVDECIQALLGDAQVAEASTPQLAAEPDGDACWRLLDQLMHISRDPDASLLFAGSTKSTEASLCDPPETDGNVAAPCEAITTAVIAPAMATELEHLLQSIRQQHEHYAHHAKLFAARIPDLSDTSLVPTQSDSSECGVGVVELGVINGEPRVARVGMDPRQFTQQICSASASQIPDQLQHHSHAVGLMHAEDWQQPSKSCSSPSPTLPTAMPTRCALWLAHVTSEVGSLLVSPTDMSVCIHNAALQAALLHECESSINIADAARSTVPPPSSSTVAQQATASLVAAFHQWNRVAQHLLDADMARASDAGSVTNATTSNALDAWLRPRLHPQIEPHPHGPLLTSLSTTASLDRPSRRTSTNLPTSPAASPSPLSVPSEPAPTTQWTFESSKLRRIALLAPAELTQSMQQLHRSLQHAQLQQDAYTTRQHQLDALREMQWQQVCVLAASQAAPSAIASDDKLGYMPPVALVDTRKPLHECMTLANDAIARIFEGEDAPRDEFDRVRAMLCSKQALLRQLYAPLGASPSCTRASMELAALTLDDMWHYVKVLRLPRDVHVLPLLRDDGDDGADSTSAYEPVLSPVELLELLLQLSNEQFAPEISPLSARMELMLTAHLPFIAQMRSHVRPWLQGSDVKKVLREHALVLRAIFRHYGTRLRVPVLSPLPSSPESDDPGTRKSMPPPRAGGASALHAACMVWRVEHWRAFLLDYKLMPSERVHLHDHEYDHVHAARLPAQELLGIFFHVQQAESTTSAEDPHWAMRYSEFCEALLGLSIAFLPDPFLAAPARLHLFIHRFLSIAPGDAHDHA